MVWDELRDKRDRLMEEERRKRENEAFVKLTPDTGVSESFYHSIKGIPPPLKIQSFPFLVEAF